MQILVTGGTGLIARHWISSRPGDHFTVLSRQASPPDLGNNVRFVTDLNQLSDLNVYTAVVNLAGEPIADRRWSTQRKQRLRESRIETTLQLVQLIAKSEQKPRYFLSGSAIGIYGNCGQAPVDEDCSINIFNQDFAQTLCLDWEAAAQGASADVPVTTLRTGVVLSAQGGALQKMLPAFKMGLGGVLGSGEQIMSWIHIRDVVSALNHLLASKPFAGPVNLTAPKPVSNRLFSQALARACRRPAWLPMPQLVMKMVMGEASQLLFDSQYVTPGVLLSQNFDFQFTDMNDALVDLI